MEVFIVTFLEEKTIAIGVLTGYRYLYTRNVIARGKQLVLFSHECWCLPRRSPGFPRDLSLSVLLYF